MKYKNGVTAGLLGILLACSPTEKDVVPKIDVDGKNIALPPLCGELINAGVSYIKSNPQLYAVCREGDGAKVYLLYEKGPGWVKEYTLHR